MRFHGRLYRDGKHWLAEVPVFDAMTQGRTRLGAKSRNAYARYEQGTSVPTVAKLDELLRAIAPERDIVVRQSDAA